MRALACLCMTGFSTQIRSTGAFQKAENSAAPSSSSCHICCKDFPGGGSVSQRTPELQRRVHGGWATISRSHPSLRISRASPRIWRLLPSSLGRRSHDHASCPFSRNAFRTVPENSQATKTRNGSNSYCTNSCCFLQLRRVGRVNRAQIVTVKKKGRVTRPLLRDF